MHFVVTVAVAVVVVGGAVAVLLLMMWLIHIACLHCFQACSIILLVLFWIRAEWWKKKYSLCLKESGKVVSRQINSIRVRFIQIIKSKILRVGSYWSINEDQCRQLMYIAFQIPYFTWIFFYCISNKSELQFLFTRYWSVVILIQSTGTTS